MMAASMSPSTSSLSLFFILVSLSRILVGELALKVVASSLPGGKHSSKVFTLSER